MSSWAALNATALIVFSRPFSTALRLRGGEAAGICHPAALTSHELRALHHVGVRVVDGDLETWRNTERRVVSEAAAQPRGSTNLYSRSWGARLSPFPPTAPVLCPAGTQEPVFLYIQKFSRHKTQRSMVLPALRAATCA